MEKKSHYFIIGLFVSISLMGLAFFAIWLAGTHDSRHYNRYTVYFYDPVSGLKDGAVVQYRGVDVGRVQDVRVAGGRSDLVKVDIEVEQATPITASSRANLATQGMTGLVFIDLNTPEGDKAAPPVIPEGEDYPVIRGSGTQIGKLFEDIPQITERILTLTDKMNKVLNDENVTSLQSTFKNVEKISSDMSLLLSEENIANTSAMIKNLSSTSESVDELVARFNKTADQMDRAVNSLNSILTDNKQNIDKFAGSGLNQITEMSRETKEMARSIRRLADQLGQEPSRLLYQPNYRGVEIKK